MASKKIAGITIELSTDTAKLTKALDKAAKQFESVGKSFTKNVTAPIMAIGGAAIAAFKSVDEGYDEMIKKTGATGETLEEFKGIFNDIAKEVPADMTTIGAAIGEVNTKFGVTGDELEELSSLFLKFADLNSQDVSTAIDGTQKALAAFGKDANSAEGFLNAMNKVAQNTGISVDKLQSGLVANAAVFQEMGLSIEQATAVMGQFEMSGVDSSTALAGLQKALKAATKDGKPLEQALSELETALKNGEGGVDGLTMAYDLFGKSGAQIYQALQNGTLSFQDLGNAAVDAGDSITDTFNETLDPLDKFKLAFQQLTIVGADLGTKILDILTPAIEKLSEWIQAISDKWNELSPETQDMIIKIGLIAAAIGPVLLLIGKVISVVSAVIAIGGKLKAALALLTGPVGLVVAAIAAAIAIGILLWKNWDTVKEKAIEIWTKIKDFFTETWDAIKTKVTETWDAIKTFFTDTWDAIKSKIEEVWNGIKEFLSNSWEGIKIAAETVWNGIKLYFETVLGFWKDLFSGVWGGIRDTVVGIWEGIKTQAEIVWNSIKMFVENPIEAVKYFITNTWDNIKSTTERIWNGIKDAITSPIEAAKNTIQRIIDWIKGLFPIQLSNIFSGFKLPHISYEMVEGFLGIKYPKFKVDWYKKAYDNAMRFTSPTVLPTSSGLKGFGDGAGAEWVVGEKSLMSMIQNAMRQNTLSPEQIYAAVRQGAADATINMYVDGRKLTDTVNRNNTTMLGNSMRMKGAM